MKGTRTGTGMAASGHLGDLRIRQLNCEQLERIARYKFNLLLRTVCGCLYRLD